MEVFSQGELEVIDEVVSPDFTEQGRTMPCTPAGREGVKFYAEAVRRAFPTYTSRSTVSSLRVTWLSSA